MFGATNTALPSPTGSTMLPFATPSWSNGPPSTLHSVGAVPKDITLALKAKVGVKSDEIFAGLLLILMNATAFVVAGIRIVVSKTATKLSAPSQY